MEGHRSYPDPGYSEGASWHGERDSGGWHGEREGTSWHGERDSGGWHGEREGTSWHGERDSAGWHGERGYPPEGRPGGSGDYGVPDPRRSEVNPGRAPADPGRPVSVGPRSGLPIPEEQGVRRAASVPGSPGPVGEMYRSRRPAAAVLFGVVAGILELPALMLLREATFGGEYVSAAGVISSVSLVAALPLLAFGLYSVATGAVRAAGPNSAQAWLRPPVAYLSVGLVLVLAAGLAA